MNPLSNPLAAAGLARTAISAVAGVAANVSQSFGGPSFSDVLKATGDEAQPLVDVTALRSKLSETIANSLAAIGITSFSSLSLTAKQGGRVTLDSDHPRAAEIESRLNEDSQVRELALQLVASASEPERRLTIRGK